MTEEIGIDATKEPLKRFIRWAPKEEIYSTITIEGKEYLDAALNKGKGVIALAHISVTLLLWG